MEEANGELLEKSARSARLEARVTDELKSQLQQAAALQGRSLSDFLVASAQDAANRVIQEHESIRLTKADRRIFVSALLDPPRPNARLAKAVKSYRKRMGL